MARAPRSVAKRHRHKKWIKRAKGFRGRRHKAYIIAKEAVLTAGQHAYNDRRKKKVAFRELWQIKINAAARKNGTTYSRLTHALKEASIEIDRKILATLAEKHPTIFTHIVKEVVTKEKATA